MIYYGNVVMIFFYDVDDSDDDTGDNASDCDLDGGDRGDGGCDRVFL